MSLTDSTDIDELKQQIAKLEGDVLHLMRHDQLTGLLNRPAFISDVDTCLGKMDRDHQKGALIEIAVRGLPRIAGTLGRHAGDYVISALAARLNMMNQSNILRCRLDHWSFAVFIPEVTDALDALTQAKKILEALHQPIDWIDRKMTVELGAGVALTEDFEGDAASLVHNAGLAVKSATEKGGPGYAFFNPSLAQGARRKHDILVAMQEAIDNNGFSLNYQPFFNTDTGQLTGFEALMRMKHPDLGSVSPAEFIVVAEESGFISKLGAWALVEACRAAASWPDHLTVAVNISPEQFYTGSLITDVHNALELSSFPAYRLEIEITESTLLKDNEVVIQQLQTLRDMGCFIVLDDFGTGYSSLSYLWKFPFQKLKIDRSFVMALDSTPMVRGMLQSIIGLARNLGLKVTAEGIEIQKHIDVLREFKCDYLQGFMLGKPVSTTEVAAIILKNYASQLLEKPLLKPHIARLAQ
jgi:diguanylate cyclase (GGDEF)-like protein